MSDNTATTSAPAAATETKIPKAIVSPLTDENDQQLFVQVGTTRVPLVRRTVPAHQRKKNGAITQVPETTSFDVDYSNPITIAQLALSALEACTVGEDRIQLAERIYGNWVNQSSTRAYVPDPHNVGETQWCEKAMGADLCAPRAQRKAGTGIEELRAERDTLNNLLVPVLEWLVDAQAGVELDYAQVRAATGTRINDLEALIEYRINLRTNLGKLQAAIKVKEDAMAKAKASREEKKNKKTPTASAAASAEPVVA